MFASFSGKGETARWEQRNPPVARGRPGGAVQVPFLGVLVKRHAFLGDLALQYS